MNQRKYIFTALAAFIWWGLSPLFWKQLSYIPGNEVLAYRIFFSMVILVLILLGQRKLKEGFRILRDKKSMGILTISTIMIGVNWYAFIYAVNSNQVLQTSLGYFMNPLLNVLIGYLFFKETIKGIEKVSLLLATIGVIILSTLGAGVPWLSLLICVTFATYGALKKILPLSAYHSLFIETFYMAIPILIYLGILESSGQGHLTIFPDNLWMILGGFVTLVPLVLFSAAAPKLELKTLGFIQYIAPSLQFLLSVLYYKEPFHKEQLAAFSLIWIALALYSGKNLMTKKLK